MVHEDVLARNLSKTMEEDAFEASARRAEEEQEKREANLAERNADKVNNPPCPSCGNPAHKESETLKTFRYKCRDCHYGFAVEKPKEEKPKEELKKSGVGEVKRESVGACPWCGSTDTYIVKSGKPQGARCRKCKKYFNPKKAKQKGDIKRVEELRPRETIVKCGDASCKTHEHAYCPCCGRRV